MSPLVRLRPEDELTRALEALQADGAFVFEGLLDDACCERLAEQLEPHLAEARVGGGTFYGNRAKRVYAVIAKASAFSDVLQHPALLAVADNVLGPNCDRYRVQLTAALETWPGGEYQPLHRDEAVYGKHLPYGPDEREDLLSFMLAVTDFTEDNGATRLVPGSHRWPRSRKATHDDEVQAVMPRGSVAVWLGSLLHGMSINRSGIPRTGVSSGYSLGWLRQEENQYLACPPDIARGLPERVQQLLGYQPANPVLGFADGHDNELQTRPGESEEEQVAQVSATFESRPQRGPQERR